MSKENNQSRDRLLARAALGELIERLNWIKFTPKNILNLSEDYQSRDREGAVDENIADRLLARAALSDKYPDAAIVSTLPQPKKSIDLIFSHLYLPHCENFNDVFAAWKDILKPEGLLMFTTLGLDPDIHDIGDLLLHTGFTDPVMDVEDDVVFGMAWGAKEKIVSVAVSEIRRR